MHDNVGTQMIPHNVAEGVYKWLTSKEMAKKLKNNERNKVQFQIQQFAKDDVETVQAIPEEGDTAL